MIDKVVFLPPSRDVLDDATVTVSSEATGLWGANVQNDHIRNIYRTRDTNSEYIRFEASGGATAINCVFIGNHSFSRTATVLWQGHTTSNFTSCSLSVALTVATDSLGTVVPKLAWYTAAATSYQFWRLYVLDAANSSGTMQVGRIMAGTYIQPSRNTREGFNLETIDPSRFQSTGGRMGYVNVRKTYDTLSYSLHDMSEPLHDDVYAMYNEVGTHRPLLVGLDPASRPHHHSYYAQFIQPLARQQRFLHNYNLNAISLEEKN